MSFLRIPNLAKKVVDPCGTLFRRANLNDDWMSFFRQRCFVLRSASDLLCTIATRRRCTAYEALTDSYVVDQMLVLTAAIGWVIHPRRRALPEGDTWWTQADEGFELAEERAVDPWSPTRTVMVSEETTRTTKSAS